MGLFDLFKKKDRPESIDGVPPSTWLPTPTPVYDYDRTQTAQTSVAKPTKKAQSKIIEDLEKANDMASIAKILAENKIISSPKDKNHNVFGQDITHLDEDGELPWGWISANKEFTERITTEYKYFLDAWYDIRNKDVRKEHWALKSLVIYLEDAKKLCISKGECFVKWFDDLIASQEHIDEYKTRQKYIEDNIDSLLKDEKRKREIEQIILPKLKESIIETIKKEPNIIQSELYKRFDPDLKAHISSELYYMEKNGLIGREKCGRSYKLFLK